MAAGGQWPQVGLRCLPANKIQNLEDKKKEKGEINTRY
jgi:hypothetical protein